MITPMHTVHFEKRNIFSHNYQGRKMYYMPRNDKIHTYFLGEISAVKESFLDELTFCVTVKTQLALKIQKNHTACMKKENIGSVGRASVCLGLQGTNSSLRCMTICKTIT